MSLGISELGLNLPCSVTTNQESPAATEHRIEQEHNIPTLVTVKPQRSGQVHKGPESTGGRLEAAGAPSSGAPAGPPCRPHGGLQGALGSQPDPPAEDRLLSC